MLLNQSEVVMICSYCSAQTESVLALSCQHYICIPCAIKHSPRASSQLLCKICQLKTVISDQALSRLRLLTSADHLVGDANVHDISSLQDALKKLDIEQYQCSKKVSLLSQLLNTSVAKIKQKFSVLKSQIDSKEASLVALTQRQHKDHVSKMQRLIIQIAHERDHLLDPTASQGKVKMDLNLLSRQIESEFSLMKKSLDMDINLKPIHNLVFDLELKHPGKEVNQKPVKQSAQPELKESATVNVTTTVRQNELIKRRSSRGDFNREDSYQRIIDKLSESKKKMNESLSVIKKRSSNGSVTSETSQPKSAKPKATQQP